MTSSYSTSTLHLSTGSAGRQENVPTWLKTVDSDIKYPDNETKNPHLHKNKHIEDFCLASR